MYNIFFYQVSIYIFLIAKNLHDSKNSRIFAAKDRNRRNRLWQTMNAEKLPVGIQSFNDIREEGYLYVDKTDIIWKLANNRQTV